MDTPSRTSGISALSRTLNKPACSAVLATVSTTTSLSLTALRTKATTGLAYASWMSGACPGIQLVPASGKSGFLTFTPRTILSQTGDPLSLSGAGVTTPSSRADTSWSTPLSVVLLLSNGPTRGCSWMGISCRRVSPDSVEGRASIFQSQYRRGGYLPSKSQRTINWRVSLCSAYLSPISGEKANGR